jgi:hypothetical protein
MNRLDRDGVQRLYEQHGRGLPAYACSFVSSFAAAEDVLHQVFERLLRGDLSISGAPVSYVYRAVRNTSLNMVRARAADVKLEEGWLDSPAGMEHTGLELQSALRELPVHVANLFLQRADAWRRFRPGVGYSAGAGTGWRTPKRRAQGAVASISGSTTSTPPSSASSTSRGTAELR